MGRYTRNGSGHGLVRWSSGIVHVNIRLLSNHFPLDQIQQNGHIDLDRIIIPSATCLLPYHQDRCTPQQACHSRFRRSLSHASTKEAMYVKKNADKLNNLKVFIQNESKYLSFMVPNFIEHLVVRSPAFPFNPFSQTAVFQAF
jgi:hypothetical protein